MVNSVVGTRASQKSNTITFPRESRKIFSIPAAVSEHLFPSARQLRNTSIPTEIAWVSRDFCDHHSRADL